MKRVNFHHQASEPGHQVVRSFCAVMLIAAACGCLEKLNLDSAGKDSGVEKKDSGGPPRSDAADDADSVVAENGASEDAGRIAAVIDGGNEDTACGACREAKCRNYSDTDLVDGCFKYLDTAHGAPAKDANFNQECANIVSCAREHNCAYGEMGPSGCYCGSGTLDDCQVKGPSSDAKCVAEWQAGVRSKVNIQVFERFADPGYPAGWAHVLLLCDVELCAAECVQTKGSKKSRAGAKR